MLRNTIIIITHQSFLFTGLGIEMEQSQLFVPAVSLTQPLRPPNRRLWASCEHPVTHSSPTNTHPSHHPYKAFPNLERVASIFHNLLLGYIPLMRATWSIPNIFSWELSSRQKILFEALDLKAFYHNCCNVQHFNPSPATGSQQNTRHCWSLPERFQAKWLRWREFHCFLTLK